MKKSLLALAVLGAFAGVASAQSSVTLSGTLDVNARYIKNGGVDQYQLGSGSLNSDQLVFSGIEDLGGGLKAGFVLNAGFNPDTGTTNTGVTPGVATNQQTSQFFNRRATVSLISNSLGEVRLGRDYVPTFWNFNLFDPFGVVGTGNFANIFSTGGKLLGTGGNGTGVDYARADNSIGYFLPSGLGGIYGQVMVAASENGSSNNARNNKYIGGRLGFAAGPINVAGAYSETTVDFPPAGYAVGDKLKVASVAGSYDFGFAKFDLQYAEFKYVDRKQDVYQAGAIVPLGQGEIHASYNGSKNKGTTGAAGFTDGDDADMYAIGYVYNLSKRTALYAQGARIKNKNGSKFFVNTQVPAPGGIDGVSSNGAEFGVRHFF